MKRHLAAAVIAAGVAQVCVLAVAVTLIVEIRGARADLEKLRRESTAHGLAIHRESDGRCVVTLDALEFREWFHDEPWTPMSSHTQVKLQMRTGDEEGGVGIRTGGEP